MAESCVGFAFNNIFPARAGEFDTFLFRMVDFLDPCGHLSLAAAVYKIDFFCSEAQGCPCRIHSDIAAADHSNFF